MATAINMRAQSFNLRIELKSGENVVWMVGQQKMYWRTGIVPVVSKECTGVVFLPISAILRLNLQT